MGNIVRKYKIKTQTIKLIKSIEDNTNIVNKLSTDNQNLLMRITSNNNNIERLTIDINDLNDKINDNSHTSIIQLTKKLEDKNKTLIDNINYKNEQIISNKIKINELLNSVTENESNKINCYINIECTICREEKCTNPVVIISTINNNETVANVYCKKCITDWMKISNINPKTNTKIVKAYYNIII